MRHQNELLARASAPKNPKPMLEQVLGDVVRGAVHGDSGKPQSVKAELTLPNGSTGAIVGTVSPAVN